VGVPWDKTSSYQRGSAAGPDAIRRATSAQLYNRCTEKGCDLASLWRVCDHGNTKKAEKIRELGRIIKAATNLHRHKNASVLFLGGDHFITCYCFSHIASLLGHRLSLLYFDAHPDLYERYEGSLYSHATVVSRILDRKDLSSGLVCYVGLRASTNEQDGRIASFGLSKYTAHDVSIRGCNSISRSIKSHFSNEPVYLSVDLDCLDPAYAPGVGNPQPGGLSTRDLIEILHGLEGLKIVAADIVEYAPKCDSKSRTTAFTSAILIKEMLGTMAKTDSLRWRYSQSE
jgi:agmatinase